MTRRSAVNGICRHAAKRFVLPLIAVLVSVALAAPGLEKVVFVGAHPDDLAGEIGLALLMKGVFEIHVIDFTHGERGCGEEKFKSGWTKATRTKEEERVCAALGAKLHWLDEVDGEAYASRTTCEKFAAVLKEIKPRAIITHWPMDSHLDHVMTYAATMKAVALANIRPEIYYHEQDHQSKGFQPVYWVDISSVEAEKERIIGFYECQNGPTSIVRNKRTAADFRGRNMHWRVSYAEAYAVYPGASQGTRCIFTEIPLRTAKKQ